MKIMQAGNKVAVNAKGARTATPRTDAEAAALLRAAPRRTLIGDGLVGGANPANRGSREAAGMKDGGLVRMTPKSTRKC